MVHISGSQPPKHATRPDLEVAQLAAEQYGVISTRQLRACGLDSSAITVRVRRGQLHRVHWGAYAVGHPRLSLRAGLIAAALACGEDAVLSHRAAGAWHTMLAWHGGRVDLIVPRGAGRNRAGIRSHHSSSLAAGDVWRRHNVLVTSPARTALDLATALSPRALRRMVRQALAEGKLNLRQLTAVLDRCPRHPGARNLRALLADGYVPTRSELEDRALDVLAGAGIERPQVNPRLVLDGRRISPDLLWRTQRVVVELDGRSWHDDPLTRADDAEKQALMEAVGLRVLRITWRQLVDHPRQTIARVRAALPPAPPATPEPVPSRAAAAARPRRRG
jgi:hypothetical protein